MAPRAAAIPAARKANESFPGSRSQRTAGSGCVADRAAPWPSRTRASKEGAPVWERTEARAEEIAGHGLTVGSSTEMSGASISAFTLARVAEEEPRFFRDARGSVPRQRGR